MLHRFLTSSQYQESANDVASLLVSVQGDCHPLDDVGLHQLSGLTQLQHLAIRMQHWGNSERIAQCYAVCNGNVT
jgi:hypothetical protein